MKQNWKSISKKTGAVTLRTEEEYQAMMNNAGDRRKFRFEKIEQSETTGRPAEKIPEPKEAKKAEKPKKEETN